MALSLGADAVWVGTRFVASVEGGAPLAHKNGVVNASVHDTHRCEAFSGRPLRIIKTKYSEAWTGPRSVEMQELLRKGVLPAQKDFSDVRKMEEKERETFLAKVGGELPKPSDTHLCGQVAGVIHDVLPAKQIVEGMVVGAAAALQLNMSKVSFTSAKL